MKENLEMDSETDMAYILAHKLVTKVGGSEINSMALEYLSKQI